VSGSNPSGGGEHVDADGFGACVSLVVMLQGSEDIKRSPCRIIDLGVVVDRKS